MSEPMIREKLRVALTEEERKEWWSGVAYEFSTTVEGDVVVREQWEDMDELYSDGCSIRIPSRVWREAIPWIEAQMRALVA